MVHSTVGSISKISFKVHFEYLSQPDPTRKLLQLKQSGQKICNIDHKVVHLQPVHYWLRPIKGVHFRFANFASHFIRVQIFQIDFPLILSASKYFRYISLSFYICRGQNEHFSINSVRKKGRVELYQIFHPSNWCTDICKTQFATFKP